MISSISSSQPKERSRNGKFQIVNHCVIEVSGAPESLLGNNDLIFLLDSLCVHMGFHIMERFYHKFEPHGLSVVFILGESHIALHSWPNKGYLHMDLVTCSHEKPSSDEIHSFISDYFKGKAEIEVTDLIY